MKSLLSEIASCEICRFSLPYNPRPILSVHENSRILIIGQAPGLKVHDSGIPWDDQSGNELRRWLGVEKSEFYNTDFFALMPMGFCYPGKGVSGDLPPRPECAPFWHNKLLEQMNDIQLTLLIGQYAQKHYLQGGIKSSLTETVKNFKEYQPKFLPLVHPSPRNKIWQKRNPWFELEVVPEIRKAVQRLLNI